MKNYFKKENVLSPEVTHGICPTCNMPTMLISLTRDSRCEDPLDKFSCMHDPKTYITLQMSAPKYTPESMTIQKPQTEIAGGVFHDFPFSIEEIEPSPQKNKVIEQSKYKITMKVH